MTAYAYKEKQGKRVARARITGVNASYKDLCEVCRSVRRRDTESAIEYLEAAAEGEKAIPMPRFGKRRGHRKELGGKRGGFPMKSARIVLGVLKSAQANASRLALGGTKVAHIIANKQDSYPRLSPKGRRVRHDYQTAFVEVVLEEVQEASTKKAEKPKAKPAEKKPEEKK